MARRIWSLKFYKAWGGRMAEKLWCNTYHVATEAEITDAAWLPLINAIGAEEKKFHLQSVNLMRAVMSTFDGEPTYSPRNLRVLELTGIGDRFVPAGETAMPLDLALKVKKNMAFGRAGTMFYRGVIHSGDVLVGAGGDPAVSSAMEPQLYQNVNLLPERISEELAALQADLIVPPKVGSQGLQADVMVRIINSFSISGISVNRRNHRYFDKQASDDGVGVGT